VNTRSIGFELVSEVPLEPNAAKRRAMWDPNGPRRLQLNTIAHWIAWLNVGRKIPIRFSEADVPGITTHWNVSKTYLDGDGHWDCWPVHQGGHFPVLYVVNRAREVVKLAGGV
jgi:hypothetical protein